MSDYDPNTPIARLFTAVVTELGDGWSVDAEIGEQHGVFLDGPYGVRLHARDIDNAYLHNLPLGRVEIYAIYPDGTDHVLSDATPHGIGLNGTRSPQAIAKSIRSRLLDNVEAEMTRIWAAFAEHAQARERRHIRRGELAATLRRRVRIGAEGEYASSSTVYHYLGDNAMAGSSDWLLSFDGSLVDITVNNLPYDKALQIAAIIAH